MKMVYGVYDDIARARDAVIKLTNEGYKRDQIYVISSSDINFFEDSHEEYVEDNRTLWEKIKDAFTFDVYDDEYWSSQLSTKDRDLLEGYKTNLEKGEFLVIYDDGEDPIPFEKENIF